jgi:hypothetical protein
MRRRSRAIRAVRRPHYYSIHILRCRPPETWPYYLSLAWKVLNKRSKLSKRKAITIIDASLQEAYACSRAINNRALNIERCRIREIVLSGCERIANCISRASAELRRHLDEVILPVARTCVADLEVIEEVIDRSITIFDRHKSEEPARTALSAMTYQIEGKRRYDTLKTDFSSLSSYDRLACEAELAAVASRDDLMTWHVFAALAGALRKNRETTPSSLIAEYIVKYVAEVGKIWKRARLKPRRAFNSENPAPHGKFHHFADLMLTAVVEPRARRYDDNLSALKEERRRQHASLPREYRSGSTAALDRADVEFLVSSHHVEKALKPIRRIQKSTPHTA